MTDGNRTTRAAPAIRHGVGASSVRPVSTIAHARAGKEERKEMNLPANVTMGDQNILTALCPCLGLDIRIEKLPLLDTIIAQTNRSLERVIRRHFLGISPSIVVALVVLAISFVTVMLLAEYKWALRTFNLSSGRASLFGPPFLVLLHLFPTAPAQNSRKEFINLILLTPPTTLWEGKESSETLHPNCTMTSEHCCSAITRLPGERRAGEHRREVEMVHSEDIELILPLHPSVHLTRTLPNDLMYH